jgi:hypothetical protein
MADHKTLQDFYNVLRNEGVRLQHQWQFSLIFPPAFTVEAAEILKDITMWAQGSTVPGRTQNIGQISYLAYEFNVPTNMTMTNNLTLTFNADAGNKIRTAMLDWMSKMSKPAILANESGEGDKKLGGVEARIDLLDDKLENIVDSYRLVGIFPQIIGDITLSNSTADIATFDVTFQYQFWDSNRERIGLPSAIGTVNQIITSASSIIGAAGVGLNAASLLGGFGR